jgi:hypothetical protein
MQLNQQTFSTPQKTETMVISRKVNKPHHPSLIMNNQQLEDVKYHKHLDQQTISLGPEYYRQYHLYIIKIEENLI